MASPISCSSCLRALTTAGSLEGWSEAAKTAPTHAHINRTGAITFFIAAAPIGLIPIRSIGAAGDRPHTAHCIGMAVGCKGDDVFTLPSIPAPGGDHYCDLQHK